MLTNHIKNSLVIVLSLIFFSSFFGLNNAYANNNSDVTFRLYPTGNIYTFIELDTSNGKMWQVHFSVDDDVAPAKIPLNLTSLNSYPSEEANQYTLQTTTNIYNLILIDQTDGRTWQVQWSFDAKHRCIIPIK